MKRIRRYEFREFMISGYVGEPVGQNAITSNNSTFFKGKKMPRSKYQAPDYMRKK